MTTRFPPMLGLAGLALITGGCSSKPTMLYPQQQASAQATAPASPRPTPQAYPVQTAQAAAQSGSQAAFGEPMDDTRPMDDTVPFGENAPAVTPAAGNGGHGGGLDDGIASHARVDVPGPLEGPH